MTELQLYLSGDKAYEAAAIRRLRRIGETAATRMGMQARDVDEIGVDFAGFILTEVAEVLRRYPGCLEGYLRRSARWFTSNRTRDVWCRRVVLMERMEDAESVDLEEARRDEVALTVVRRQFMEKLEELVSSLPAAERSIYQLCVVEGRSCAEAAELMACTPAAARKRLERLRRHLRARLKLHP